MSEQNTTDLIRRLYEWSQTGAVPATPTSTSANMAPVPMMEAIVDAWETKVASEDITATMVVGIEAADVINVAIQLVDPAGTAVAERMGVMWYLSTDAEGDNVAAAAPSGGIAIGTDGLLFEWTANLAGWAISEVDGDIDVSLTETGDGFFYLILVMPNGKLVVSDIIDFVHGAS
jgi:hypothetical protein